MVRSLRFLSAAPLQIIAALAMSVTLYAGGKSIQSHRPPRRVAGVPHSTLLNVNNIAMWATDDGTLERQTESQSAGVTFPRGTATCVYAGGLLWGGFVHDGSAPLLRVGGQTYSAGTVPGRIILPGVSEDPTNADVHVYRVRRDWQTADLRRDAADYFEKDTEDVTAGDMAALRQQYQDDWVHWPWQKGAPYYDRDGVPGYQPDPSGAYNPSGDEPGLAGADEVLWIVCNDLDPNAVFGFSGSTPIGLELQITCWAYNRPGALGDELFQRYRLIYKGLATTPATAKIDSMYLAKWVDPDLGDNTDDYIGCIPSLNTGFVYNSHPVDNNYSGFGITPPVVGYGILQGPVVPSPGSTAHRDFRTIAGYANLPMTAFAYFALGGQMPDPSADQSPRPTAWWPFLQGYCYVDPLSGRCTQFPLSGNPQTRVGWVDGTVDAAGDRKMLLSSGPFQMALGDTQEVVICLAGATGSDNLTGIPILTGTIGSASDLLQEDFNPPMAIASPDLRTVELDSKVILDWESDTTTTNSIEGYRSQGFRFETYRIYQFRGPDTSDGYVMFPPFDVTQPRSLQVTTDLLRNHGLVDGQKYYYAVTATEINPDSSIHLNRIESPIIIHTVVPHTPNPGTIYPYRIGDTVANVQNFIGFNDATVRTIFYDPSKADGRVYKVLFHHPPPGTEKATWDFVDSTAAETLLTFMSAGIPPVRLVTRGFTVEVKEPQFGFKNVYQSQYAFQPTPYSVVFNNPNPQSTYMVVGGGSSQLDTIIGYTVSDRDLEWRFLGDSSWAVWVGHDPNSSRWMRVPYTMWQMDRAGKPTGRQLYTFITDHAQDSVWRPTVLLDYYYNGHPISVFYPVSAYVDSVRDNGITYAGVYKDSIPWSTDSFAVKALLWISSRTEREKAELWKAYIADLDGDGIPAPKGTIIRFVQNKQVQDHDVKVVAPSAVVTDDPSAAKQAVQRVNVFPNPYYGLNRAELSRTDKFVTFNHLPRYATIHIMTLAGIPVRTIVKDDETQFATWDLNNQNALPVASGIYLASIGMKDASGIDLGTAILKIMLVQEQRFFLTR